MMRSKLHSFYYLSRLDHYMYWTSLILVCDGLGEVGGAEKAVVDFILHVAPSLASHSHAHLSAPTSGRPETFCVLYHGRDLCE